MKLKLEEEAVIDRESERGEKERVVIVRGGREKRKRDAERESREREILKERGGKERC